jgi:dienelactone hydrolase
LGETYALRARAFAEMEKCEDALRVADEALNLSEESAAEDALRIQARCLSHLGRDAEAEKTLLRLIGATVASNPADRNALVTMLAKERKQVEPAQVDRMIDAAIESARDQRSEELARQGATLVELAGEDRVRLEATFRPGRGDAAVVFVPDTSGRRTTFTPYAQLLSLDGYATLTLDPRGQGDSRCDSLPSHDAMPLHHRDEVSADVATAVAYLVNERAVARERIVVVAAGTACAVVERAMHEHRIAPAVVYLSPILAADDRDVASAVSFRAPRPALVLASQEDIYAIRSQRAFAASLPAADVTTKVYTSAGHGASLLRDPARFLDVDEWIKKTIPLTAAQARD